MHPLTDITHIRAMLAGGDRRSIGRADELAADTLAGRVEPGALFRVMLDDEDELMRMRAADALEKVSVQYPGSLHPFKDELLARLPGITQTELRWHLALMLPRLPLTADERRRQAVPVLLGYLQDKSRLVQTFALQALGNFAAANASLRPRVRGLLEDAVRVGGPAVKARARRLLTSFPK